MTSKCPSKLQQQNWHQRARARCDMSIALFLRARCKILSHLCCFACKYDVMLGMLRTLYHEQSTHIALSVRSYAPCLRTPRTGGLLIKRAGARMPEETCIATLRLRHPDHEDEDASHDEPCHDDIE